MGCNLLINGVYWRYNLYPHPAWFHLEVLVIRCGRISFWSILDFIRGDGPCRFSPLTPHPECCRVTYLPLPKKLREWDWGQCNKGQECTFIPRVHLIFRVCFQNYVHSRLCPGFSSTVLRSYWEHGHGNQHFKKHWFQSRYPMSTMVNHSSLTSHYTQRMISKKVKLHHTQELPPTIHNHLHGACCRLPS